MSKAPVFQEDFAEVCLNNEWLKIEILKRNVDVEGVCLVQRLDGCGERFMVNAKDLAPFGSSEQESDWQIRKRVQYEKVKELLEKEGWTIERIVEDGNCLFRAAARQLLGDEEKHLEIRHETVEYIIANRSFYSEYEVNIEERLFEQLMNRSWGGHMEIDAIAKRYNVGIVVWELSKTGQLVTPISKPRPISSKGPQNLYLVRHRGVHYDCVFQKDGNCCLIQSRCHSKSTDRMKTSSSNALESTTITVTPMELDEEGASNGGVGNTHGRSAKGDGLVLPSLHQTTISGFSKTSTRNVDEPDLDNTVHDAEDCCMVGCDETSFIAIFGPN